jgi:hypothetical protein
VVSGGRRLSALPQLVVELADTYWLCECRSAWAPRPQCDGAEVGGRSLSQLMVTQHLLAARAEQLGRLQRRWKSMSHFCAKDVSSWAQPHTASSATLAECMRSEWKYTGAQ